MTQKQHILLILGKDLLFILVALFLIVKGRFLWAVVGVLGLLLYGQDFSLRIKQLGRVKDSGRDNVKRSSEPQRSSDAPIEDNGKIQVTDLSGAKEVDFEKE